MTKILAHLIMGAVAGLLATLFVLGVQIVFLVVTHCEFEYHLWAGIVNIACK